MSISIETLLLAKKFSGGGSSGSLPISGGTMAGNINMDAHKITNLSDATNDGDAVNLGQAMDLISTNTGYFRGSFNSKNALTSASWQSYDPELPNYVTNNDYSIVLDDETKSHECWRYAYVDGTGWTAQYRINESPMTAAQIAAINSGATAALIAQITANQTAIGQKYTKPSGGIPKTDLASAVQTSLGKADTATQSATVTTIWTGTQAEYDAIANKDTSTLYCIKEEE